jgi:hypothetical protein
MSPGSKVVKRRRAPDKGEHKPLGLQATWQCWASRRSVKMAGLPEVARLPNDADGKHKAGSPMNQLETNLLSSVRQMPRPGL